MTGRLALSFCHCQARQRFVTIEINTLHKMRDASNLLQRVADRQRVPTTMHHQGFRVPRSSKKYLYRRAYLRGEVSSSNLKRKCPQIKPNQILPTCSSQYSKEHRVYSIFHATFCQTFEKVLQNRQMSTIPVFSFDIFKLICQ